MRNANTLIVRALCIESWESDFHLFPLTLLLGRPIFMYVFFSSTDEDGVKTLLADIDNVNVFAQKFLAFAPGTKQHLQWCSSVHRALLISGDITTLPHLPLALFFLHTVILQHWCPYPLYYCTYSSHLAKCSTTKHLLLPTGSPQDVIATMHAHTLLSWLPGYERHSSIARY